MTTNNTNLLQQYHKILSEVGSPDGTVINKLTQMAQQLHHGSANEASQMIIDCIMNVSFETFNNDVELERE
jgi:hypothetical protein